MRSLAKYKIILLTLLSGMILFGLIYFEFKTNNTSDLEKFQQRFQSKQEQLDRFLEIQLNEAKHHTDYANWKSHREHASFFLHVYSGDSLIYWNTNRLPVRQYADIHFPANGVIQLQNGWYYSKMEKEGDLTLCASFLIREEYEYENKNLINDFARDFTIPFQAVISLDHEGFEIQDKKGDFLFSLLPQDADLLSDKASISISIFLLLFVSLLLWLTFDFLRKKKAIFSILALIAVVLIRWVSIKGNWLEPLQTMEIMQPRLYASSELFPNFLEFLINCIFLVFGASLLVQLLSRNEMPKVKWLGILLLFSLFPAWHLVLVLHHGLIENSSIPLIIDQLFSLNTYSILAIVSMGALIYGFFRLSTTCIYYLKNSKISAPFVAVLLFVSGLVYFLVEITLGNELLISSLFPLIFLSLNTFFIYKKEDDKLKLSIGILNLILFSGLLSINLAELSERKEQSERILYANQLATDKDLVTELEYDQLSKRITNDPFLQKFITSPLQMRVSDFEDAMERRYFKGFWERYEMSFNFFDENNYSLIVDESQNVRYEDLERLIKNHGQVSEVNPSIYFIQDYVDQYSYVIREEVTSKDGKKGILFCRLRSKKIPEEIGFPRLLISSKANVLESLENYSIARYYKGKLVTRYGSFNYPTNNAPIKEWRTGTGFVDMDGYNHYILQKTGVDLIVLSQKNYRIIELITSFSYIFCFFGLLLLPFLLFGRNGSPLLERALSLSLRIRFIMIGLVVVALVGFGWGSGVFVKNQYNDYTFGIIREKMSSVDLELRSKIGTKKELDIDQDGNYMEYLLRKFSKVFITDINIYNTRGILVASSRPKVFNIGLMSEQINPTAYLNVAEMNKSDFIHQETIGTLSFLSAYQPIYNNEGNLLGYINLQHFGQQKDFENQIQRFLIAIINVFMLLLALSIILAIFVSNWVTSPLRILQESFAALRFGAENQKIEYNRNDEIGALVKDYNKKLEELEFAANKLAQSERESAWREMAKQVAHEIKNPLTPMKLSVQQLLRVYDPSDPNSAQKLEKVVSSLIEQIDALTNIANEFSNFAKMPRPNEEKIDLLKLMHGVIELFSHDEHVVFHLKSEMNSALVMGDKDQLLRVFNNLIKNGIQAIPEHQNGEIEITLFRENNDYCIKIKDNGSGIEKDLINKVFVPYFTTRSTGTGLGLAMCRQIIEGHRGNIHLESTSDQGTVFAIRLPAAE